MFVFWADSRSGTNDIYAHHVLAGGTLNPGWPEQGLAICTAGGTQSGQVAVQDGSGGVIVAWQDNRASAQGDVYAHRVSSAGVDPAWPLNGRALCTSSAVQQSLAIVTDGAGGAIVLWQDDRSTAYDIYAQRVLASGAVDPAWPVDGRALCAATNHQQKPAAVSDNAGGAIVAWEDARTGSINDIYAGRILSTGVVDPAWPLDGRAVCTATGAQVNAAIVSDGGGGAVIVWEDSRSGQPDIYASHVLGSGTLDSDWTANGAALCLAAGFQQNPVITTDGAGGAIAAWRDARVATDDVYAQHIDARGDVDGAWPVDGRALTLASGPQSALAIHSDGAGGAVVAWTDDRTGVEDVYAQHVLASGVNDTAWPVDGRGVSTAPHFQQTPAVLDDGNGGTLLAWQDFRNGQYDIYAQRIGRHGYLGTPEPELVSVEDVPNDQGGAVKLSWDASYLDQQSNPELDFYDVLRSVPSGVAAGMRARGARVRSLGVAGEPRAGDLFVTSAAGATYYWEFLASVSARHYLGGYSYIAATAGDSVGGSNPLTSFLVVGRNSAITMWWPSLPMSGYSVDDLAPATPAPFTGEFSAGTMRLHWNPNTEPDLGGYRLYRGATADFVPGPGTLVASLPDTGYADAAGTPSHYKLTAVDVHGNESPVASLSPVGLVGVGGPGTAGALSFTAATPVSSVATLRFVLPAATDVRLAIYDATGRLVREMGGGRREGGAHAETWDLCDAGGHAVGAGLFFARLEAGGRALTRRIAVVR
jgi:hypothetical protein